MKIKLCALCQRDRAVHGRHARAYVESATSLWRERCDDCGIEGSSGGPAGLAVFTLGESEAAL